MSSSLLDSIYWEERKTHTVNTRQLHRCTNSSTVPALFTWTPPQGNRFLCPGRWLDLQKANKQCQNFILSSVTLFCFSLSLSDQMTTSERFQEIYACHYSRLYRTIIFIWPSSDQSDNFIPSQRGWNRKTFDLFSLTIFACKMFEIVHCIKKK